MRRMSGAVIVGVFIPALAFAQASITGVVRDSSGAVLPGVTVEAASPALIEKVRTAVTDGTGQYRVIDLRPGVYSVTFALQGFNTVKRDGIELAGTFTATVNADLRVGAIEETITVTGTASIVDVQSTSQQRVMDREILDAIPAGRSHLTLSVLIPGVTRGVQDVGGQNTLALGTVAIHGSRADDQRVLVDGHTIRHVAGTGSLSNFIPDMGSTTEMTVDYAAGSAEAVTGGISFNYIPREGGNRFSGNFFATGANSSFQSDNFTEELEAQGLRSPNRLHSVYDVSSAAGGPLSVDRLWFYSSGRWQANRRYVAGLWENLNAGDPTKWTYEPDYSRQALFDLTQFSVNARFTWQATPKNKINFYYEHQSRDYIDTRSNFSPESNPHWLFPKLRTATVGWTSPVTNRLLFEARAMTRGEDIVNEHPPDGSIYRTLIHVTEQGGLIPGLRYRGKGINSDTSTSTFGRVATPNLMELKGSVSFITGAHAFKTGISNFWGYQSQSSYDIASATSYRFNNGVPNQIQQRATEYLDLTTGLKSELGVFAQDKWTMKRLTVNAGLRFDYYNAGFKEMHIGPTVLAPRRDITFPDTTWNEFFDLNPRIGAVYDLFGNGRTALKVNAGRYVIALNPFDGNPVRDQLVNRVTRSWNDADRDYVPDCNLVNPLENGECGTISDLNFGGATISTAYDRETQQGWHRRTYNWEFSAGVQHEIVSRVGVDVGYFRRTYGNFIVTDNRAITAADFSPFQITAPADPRLPDGGGQVIGGLYNLNPDKVGRVDNFVTFSENFGGESEHWNGVDVSVNARPRSGVLLQGGVSTGRRTTDQCGLRPNLPETGPVDPYCHVQEAFLTQVKLLGTYTVPRVDVQVAATFQSLPGPQILANHVVPNAQVIPSLGRPLSGGAANVTVNLVEPGTMYGERMNQMDLRVGKILRYGRTRTSISLDIYNAFNGNYVRSVNNSFAAWQRPTGILDARVFKISGQFDF